MKTSKKIILAGAIITIIVGAGTILKWLGAFGMYLEMLNSIQWLFIFIFITYIVVFFVTFISAKRINQRLDAFNETIRLAGSQHQESIDRVNNSLYDILKKLPDTSK
ncbi:MAG: hypothetical protein ACYDEQ_00635 [Desulfocucumaceae bacterium]